MEMVIVAIGIELGFWTFTLGFWVLVGIVVPKLFKPRRVGQILGLTERTIRQWIATQTIEVVKIHGSVRIPATEVERLIREGRRPALLGRTHPQSGPEQTGEGPGSSSQSVG